MQPYQIDCDMAGHRDIDRAWEVIELLQIDDWQVVYVEESDCQPHQYDDNDQFQRALRRASAEIAER